MAAGRSLIEVICVNGGGNATLLGDFASHRQIRDFFCKFVNPSTWTGKIGNLKFSLVKLRSKIYNPDSVGDLSKKIFTTKE
jgi:hypothetical protein